MVLSHSLYAVLYTARCPLVQKNFSDVAFLTEKFTGT